MISLIISFIATFVVLYLLRLGLINLNNESIGKIIIALSVFMIILYIKNSKVLENIILKIKQLCYQKINQFGYVRRRSNESYDGNWAVEESISRNNKKNRSLEEKITVLPFYKEKLSYDDLCYYQSLIDSYEKEENCNFSKFYDSYVWILSCKLDKKKSDEDFSEIIDMLLSGGNYETAKLYCERFFDFHVCEESYLKKLKYYYLISDEDNFYKVFDEFTTATIKFTDKGIEFVKFWIS